VTIVDSLYHFYRWELFIAWDVFDTASFRNLALLYYSDRFFIFIFFILEVVVTVRNEPVTFWILFYWITVITKLWFFVSLFLPTIFCFPVHQSVMHIFCRGFFPICGISVLFQRNVTRNEEYASKLFSFSVLAFNRFCVLVLYIRRVV
jgi:hypothetical protein